MDQRLAGVEAEEPGCARMSRSGKQVGIGVAVLAALGSALWLWFAQRQSTANDSPDSVAINSAAVPFGYKTAWFAVHSEDPRAVAQSLGLKDVRPSAWSPGLTQATDGDGGMVFVTPPVRGWVLAVGKALLLDPHWEQQVQALSRQFGEAQYFASMRDSSAHAWARAHDGEIVCLFESRDGQEPLRVGFERELESVVRLRFADGRPPTSKEASADAQRQTPFPDEKDVQRVAAIWSIDPIKMNEYPEAQQGGLLGRFSHPAP